jgi:hypothetical protein
MLSRVMTTKNLTIKRFRKLEPLVLLGWVNMAHADCMVLPYRLLRSSLSMSSMADALVVADCRVANISYPSRL